MDNELEPLFPFSFLARHPTMHRNDYCRYFRNPEHHPAVVLDNHHSSQIDHETVRLVFSTREDYELALQIAETDLMLSDSSVRIVACDVDARPQRKDINSDKAIYVRAREPIQNLAFFFAQFGPVATALSIPNQLSSIIIFFSAESARRAKSHIFPVNTVWATDFARPSPGLPEA